MDRLLQSQKKVQVIKLAYNSPLVKIKKLNKYFETGHNSVHILKSITLSINSGEFISIMGPSGSGKSTLINILGLLDYEFDGDYELNGQTIGNYSDEVISNLRNKMVGFIFQDFNLIESMSVKENIQLPLLYYGLSSKQTRTLIKEALYKVGLSEKENSYIHELSGGQKQRVAIARALINKPRFIIADEPTGALDTENSKIVMDTLKRLNEEGVTIIMVTHDSSLQEYANRHFFIVDGVLKEIRSLKEEAFTYNFDNSDVERSADSEHK